MPKRKDKKNRILRNGEGQRSDGRYFYKYKDAKGDTHYVYSWKLEPYDIPPAGKKSALSLREMEKQIIRNDTENISLLMSCQDPGDRIGKNDNINRSQNP